jgi:flagellar biogenesis protein FliO
MRSVRPANDLIASARRAARIAGATLVIAATGCPAAAEGFDKKFPSGGSGDLTGMLWQLLAAAIVLLVVGAACIFAVRRLLPKLRRATGKRVAVLETTYLGPRKTVHLLQVGQRRLLVAAGPEGVVKLDDVTEAFGEDFAEVARRVAAERSGRSDRPTPPADQDTGDPR